MNLDHPKVVTGTIKFVEKENFVTLTLTNSTKVSVSALDGRNGAHSTIGGASCPECRAGINGIARTDQNRKSPSAD